MLYNVQHNTKNIILTLSIYILQKKKVLSIIEDMLETRSRFRLFVFVFCFSVLVHLCKFSDKCEYYRLERDIVMISLYCSSLFFFVFCEQGQMVFSWRIYASGKDLRDTLS